VIVFHPASGLCGLGNKMENILVVLIVGLAAGLLGRGYYKKYKSGNPCRCGCTSCPVDDASCEFPEERQKQINAMLNRMESYPADSSSSDLK
jgi:hypothetical protein